MKFFKTINPLQKEIKRLRKKGLSIGLVPTMGALHEGHFSLVDKCRRDNDIVILSIFVNPAQFGPKEDFKKYPREEKKDVLLAKKRKIDIIFCPSGKEMYQPSFLTFVQVKELDSVLCGKSRPGHFTGVATVVMKLLGIVQPDQLFFGQKDIQQALIIKRMINDLNVGVKLRICPTVREKDGLAMSSRNAHLSEQQRKEAAVLHYSLKKAKESALQGEKSSSVLKRNIYRNISRKTSARIEYIECVDAQNLKKVYSITGKNIIALAAKFGKTRLIDNITVTI